VVEQFEELLFDSQPLLALRARRDVRPQWGHVRTRLIVEKAFEFVGKEVSL
jgi:hypothetical protein